MKKYLPFFSYFLINTVVLYLAASFLPANYVIGSSFLPFFPNLLWSGLILTLLIKMGKPFSKTIKFKIEGGLKKFFYYWLVSSVAVWIVARLAVITGFGISGFYWAIVLGFVLKLLHWGVWKCLKIVKI